MTRFDPRPPSWGYLSKQERVLYFTVMVPVFTLAYPGFLAYRLYRRVRRV